MNSILEDEIISINAIYEPDTLVKSNTFPTIYVLKIPGSDSSIRIRFPADYPHTAPTIEGPEASGAESKKGAATQVVNITRNTLDRIFQPDVPCIYDLLEETSHSNDQPETELVSPTRTERLKTQTQIEQHITNHNGEDVPPWVLSSAITEKKSMFFARAAPVHAVDEAEKFISHLLENDKKVAKATHNITAWRIQGQSEQDKDHKSGVQLTFQDCNDDGETAAGGRLLHLLQMMDVWNVLVVVSRWYGGIQLGPDRFRIISTVAREAIVNGGFVGQAKESKKIKK